jgi:hypothetical protein
MRTGRRGTETVWVNIFPAILAQVRGFISANGRPSRRIPETNQTSLTVVGRLKANDLLS